MNKKQSVLQLTLQPYINHNLDNPYPKVKITYGNDIVFDDDLKTTKEIKYPIYCDNELVIEHYGKVPSDTTVEDDIIVADKAVELKSIKVNDFVLPLVYLYDCKYCVVWNDETNTMNNTLYFGFNGEYKVPIKVNSLQFKFYTMWEEERQLNYKNQQQRVNELGEIVETFTRFGEETNVSDSQIPSIDELYKIVCELN